MDAKDVELYESYRKAKREWAAYVVPIAQRAFSERLTALGRHYYYDMVYKNLSDKNTELDADTDTGAVQPETKALYKKLALIFHPDKYHGSDALFKIINRYAKEDNIDALKAINLLSKEICQENLTMERLSELVDIMNSPERLSAASASASASTLSFEDESVDDLECLAYRWYVGSAKTKKIIEGLYYTDAQLLEHLRRKSTRLETLDYYINYCKNREDLQKEILIIKIGKIQEERARLEALNAMYRETLEIRKQNQLNGL